MGLFADAGLPMISYFLPAVWLAIIPIILIEAWVGVRVAKLPFRQSLCGATVGNLFSTLLGIPLTWMALAIVEFRYFGAAKGLGTFSTKAYAVTFQAPWLIPYEEDLVWMAPIAVVVLSVTMWLISVVSEYVIVKRISPSVPSATLWRWMWRGNAASYAFLVLLVFALPLLGPIAAWMQGLANPIADELANLVCGACDVLFGRP
jgi:hypothetical protein